MLFSSPLSAVGIRLMVLKTVPLCGLGRQASSKLTLPCEVVSLLDSETWFEAQAEINGLHFE